MDNNDDNLLLFPHACVQGNYRLLNSVGKTDVFLLPRVDNSCDQLASSHLFTILDLASGYWQILVDAKSQETGICNTLRPL